MSAPFIVSGLAEVQLSGEPEVQAMLAQFTGRELNNRTRRALRAAVKPMREEMRARGKAGKYPRKFAQTRTRGHRNPPGVSVNPKSPLSTIFEHGAKAHPIEPKKATVLANEKTGFFSGGAVTHPGMAAIPFIAPVFAAAKERAMAAFSETLMADVK